MDSESVRQMIEYLTTENIRLHDENEKLKAQLAGIELLLKAKGVDINGEQ